MNIDWNLIMSTYVLPALFAALAFFVSQLLRAGTSWLTTSAKGILHFRGSEIVIDSLLLAAQRLGPQFSDAIKDGKITDAEWGMLKAEASKIAQEKLSGLAGFYKADLMGWIDQQIDIAWGKLTARLFARGNPS